MDTGVGMRFLLYSHDGLGLGHVRRNLTVAAALTALAPGASVLVATGVDEVSRLGVPPGVEVLKLPGLQKAANGHYASRRLRISDADAHALRASLLTTAVKSFRPQVMLVDRHPLGAGGELIGALEALRRIGGRAALGLRDILDDRATVLREWADHDLHARIAEYYDRVLVYGQPTVLDPAQEYNFPASIAARTHFCGYVLNRPPGGWSTDPPPTFADGSHRRPVVLATPGGGEDGFALLEAFIRVATGAAWEGVLVTGPLASAAEQQTLHALAAERGITCHTFVAELGRWFSSVDALVCMGGYNTLVEAVSAGTPTVCVPRIVPRTEQLIRARVFAQLGLLRILEPPCVGGLDARALRGEVDAVLTWSRREVAERAHATLGFDGAHRAADQLLDLALVGDRSSVGLARLASMNAHLGQLAARPCRPGAAAARDGK